MISTINLYNQLFFKADKIYDILPYNMLSIKLLSKPVSTQTIPQKPFRFSLVFSILLCPFVQHGV